MFGAIAGGIASALAGGAMSKLFGGGQKAASGGIQGDVLATDNNTVGMGDAGIRSEERRVGKECRYRAADEIGLGIPAEPLFRSLKRLFVSSHLSEVIYVWCYCWRYCFCSCWWRHV